MSNNTVYTVQFAAALLSGVHVCGSLPSYLHQGMASTTYNLGDYRTCLLES